MTDKTIFFVAKGRGVSHSGDNKLYKEGEQIDLSHLAPAEIAAVIASGAVQESNPFPDETPPVAKAKPAELKKEVKSNG